MSPSNVFGIIVRVFGLSLLIYSVWYLSYGVAIGFALIDQQRTSIGPYFLSGGVFLILSLYLLRGAPHVIRFSYPSSPPSE